MKAILEKFPKAVLIEFILKDCGFHLISKDYLEGQLLHYQWDQEEEAIALERAEIAAEHAKYENWDIPGHHYKYMEAVKRGQRVTARWNRNEKVYEQSRKLMGY